MSEMGMSMTETCKGILSAKKFVVLDFQMHMSKPLLTASSSLACITAS